MSLFLLAVAAVTALLGVGAVFGARCRIDHLRSTGETFAHYALSRSRAVLSCVVALVVAANVMVARNIGLSFALVGFGVAITGCAYLALIDIDTHLLPWSDSIALGVASCLFLMADAVVRSHVELIVVMVASGVSAWIVFRIIEWLSRGDLGGGDVVLASVLGVILGWFGGAAVLQAMVYSIVCAGVFALGAMLFSGFRARTAFAFGPFLILGAVLVMITTDPLLVATY